MGIGVFLSKIPWFKLLHAVPPIVRTAREIMQSTQRTATSEQTTPQDSDLGQRLSLLEENDRKHYEMMQKMSEQLQTITHTLHLLSARLQAVFFLALFSLLIAVTVLILYLR